MGEVTQVTNHNWLSTSPLGNAALTNAQQDQAGKTAILSAYTNVKSPQSNAVQQTLIPAARLAGEGLQAQLRQSLQHCEQLLVGLPALAIEI